MKKILCYVTAVFMSGMIFAGCGCNGEDETEILSLPIEDGLSMMFSSGAGAWSTNISLNADGSFSGDFHDTDMGSYTIEECNFTGAFSIVEKIEDYAYKMKLEKLETAHEEGEESIYDLGDGQLLYVVQSSPYGIENGEEFVFYLPSTPVSVLDEVFLTYNHNQRAEGDNQTLGCYGLYNVVEETGFFTYEE